jgi:hypothetical protein
MGKTAFFVDIFALVYEPCFDCFDEFSCAFCVLNGRVLCRQKNERLSGGWHFQTGATL